MGIMRIMELWNYEKLGNYKLWNYGIMENRGIINYGIMELWKIVELWNYGIIIMNP